jgi:hypothetical protein
MKSGDQQSQEDIVQAQLHPVWEKRKEIHTMPASVSMETIAVTAENNDTTNPVTIMTGATKNIARRFADRIAATDDAAAPRRRTSKQPTDTQTNVRYSP